MLLHLISNMSKVPSNFPSLLKSVETKIILESQLLWWFLMLICTFEKKSIVFGCNYSILIFLGVKESMI